MKAPYDSIEDKNLKKYEGKSFIDISSLRQAGNQSFGGKYNISSNGNKAKEPLGKVPNDEEPDPPIINVVDANNQTLVNNASRPSTNSKDPSSNEKSSKKGSNGNKLSSTSVVPTTPSDKKGSKKSIPPAPKTASKKQNKDFIVQIIDAEVNEVENPFDHYQTFVSISGSFMKPLIYKPLTPRVFLHYFFFLTPNRLL